MGEWGAHSLRRFRAQFAMRCRPVAYEYPDAKAPAIQSTPVVYGDPTRGFSLQSLCSPWFSRHPSAKRSDLCSTVSATPPVEWSNLWNPQLVTLSPQPDSRPRPYLTLPNSQPATRSPQPEARSHMPQHAKHPEGEGGHVGDEQDPDAQDEQEGQHVTVEGRHRLAEPGG